MMSEDEVYPKKRTSSAARPSETVQHENGTEEDFYAEQDGPGIVAFFQRQVKYFNENPAITVAYWACALVNFFVFIGFFTSWHGSSTDIDGCDNKLRTKHFLFSTTQCCNFDELSEGIQGGDFTQCIVSQLRNIGGKARDAGAAAFFFSLVGLGLALLLQHLLGKKQRGEAPHHYLERCTDKFPMVILAAVTSFCFMLAFSVYVGIFEDEDVDGTFGFGVAANIIGFMIMLALVPVLFLKFDADGLPAEATETSFPNPAAEENLPAGYSYEDDGDTQEQA